MPCMLSLFVRALVMIWAICCLILAAILAKAQPLTGFGTGFALCSVPCWAGVEPGRTAIDQVPELINSHLSDVTWSLRRTLLKFLHPPCMWMGLSRPRQESLCG